MPLHTHSGQIPYGSSWTANDLATLRVRHRLLRAIAAIIAYAELASDLASAALLDRLTVATRGARELTRPTGSGALTESSLDFDASLTGTANRRAAGIASVRIDVVVNNAITVVVQTIALLGARGDASRTGELALDTDQLSLLTLAHVDATGISELLGGILGIDGSIKSIRGGPRLVNLAVAVVVLAVTDLWLGPNTTHTNRAALAVALVHAGLTLSLVPLPGVQRGVVCRRAGSTERDPIVVDAIAIVVLAVARFRGFHPCRCT